MNNSNQCYSDEIQCIKQFEDSKENVFIFESFDIYYCDIFNHAVFCIDKINLNY